MSYLGQKKLILCLASSALTLEICAHIPFLLRICRILFFAISKFINISHRIAYPSTIKSFHNLTMTFPHMTSHWMQKSCQNFPNSTTTTCYCEPTSFKWESATMELVLTISPCETRRQSVPFLTLSQVKSTVSFTTTKGYIPKKNVYLLFWMMLRSPHLVYTLT